MTNSLKVLILCLQESVEGGDEGEEKGGEGGGGGGLGAIC